MWSNKKGLRILLTIFAAIGVWYSVVAMAETTSLTVDKILSSSQEMRADVARLTDLDEQKTRVRQFYSQLEKLMENIEQQIKTFDDQRAIAQAEIAQALAQEKDPTKAREKHQRANAQIELYQGQLMKSGVLFYALEPVVEDLDSLDCAKVEHNLRRSFRMRDEQRRPQGTEENEAWELYQHFCSRREAPKEEL